MRDQKFAAGRFVLEQVPQREKRERRIAEECRQQTAKTLALLQHQARKYRPLSWIPQRRKPNITFLLLFSSCVTFDHYYSLKSFSYSLSINSHSHSLLTFCAYHLLVCSVLGRCKERYRDSWRRGSNLVSSNSQRKVLLLSDQASKTATGIRSQNTRC